MITNQSFYKRNLNTDSGESSSLKEELEKLKAVPEEDDNDDNKDDNDDNEDNGSGNNNNDNDDNNDDNKDDDSSDAEEEEITPTSFIVSKFFESENKDEDIKKILEDNKLEEEDKIVAVIKKINDKVKNEVENFYKEKQKEVSLFMDGASKEEIVLASKLKEVKEFEPDDIDDDINKEFYKNYLKEVKNLEDEEEIESIIDNLISKDKLKTKISEIKPVYEKFFDTKLNQFEDNRKTQAKLEEEKFEETKKKVFSTVENGFFGISLPESEAKDFNDYLFKVDEKTGMSKADERYLKASIEEKVFIDYLLKNDFNIEGLSLAKKASKNNKKPKFTFKSKTGGGASNTDLEEGSFQELIEALNKK